MQKDNPLVSVVIPSYDGYRNGCLPKLLESLKKQSFQNFELIVMKGYRRQGKAINEGVKKAKGVIIIILDDDTILGHHDVFRNLVQAIKGDTTIGMAGVSKLIPDNVPWFVRRGMQEIPRQSSAIVNGITDSDLAEHPCCAIPKKVFWQVGGENEDIPRGLDPYLRYKIRQAGYRVVVIPQTWIYHLIPDSVRKIAKRYFQNGKAAAYCSKFYPGLVHDQAQRHKQPSIKRLSLPGRMLRYLWRMFFALITFKWIWLFAQVSNALGFIWGSVTASKKTQG